MNDGMQNTNVQTVKTIDLPLLQEHFDSCWLVCETEMESIPQISYALSYCGVYLYAADVWEIILTIFYSMLKDYGGLNKWKRKVKLKAPRITRKI